MSMLLSSYSTLMILISWFGGSELISPITSFDIAEVGYFSSESDFFVVSIGVFSGEEVLFSSVLEAMKPKALGLDSVSASAMPEKNPKLVSFGGV